MEVKCQIHVPVVLTPRKEPSYALDGSFRGPIAALDPVEMEESVLHLDGIEPQFLLRADCSLSSIKNKLSLIKPENLLATGSEMGIEFSVMERNFPFVIRTRESQWPAQISLQCDSNS